MGKLTEQIRADLTESMKARTAERTSTLRMLQAALKNEQINAGHELSDEEAMSVIRKGIKQRQDSVAELESGLREIIASTGAQSKKDMGKVMKEATARYRGRADGKKIQEVVS